MLTEIYVEALLVNEELADQVWDKGEIDDQIAWFRWWCIFAVPPASIGDPKSNRLRNSNG
jgi:hypothetical protein